MRITIIAAVLAATSMTSACGSDVRAPEVIYEKGLDDTGYLDCMVELLIIDSQCRLQRSDRLFESCMAVHHKFCLESNEELKRGGVR